MRALVTAWAVLALAYASSASMMGGLVIGSADDNANDVLFLAPGEAPMPLFSDQGVWGLGADNANGVLYISESDRLYAWDFAEFGNMTPPTQIATMTQGAGEQLRPAGLTWANGKLYGSEVNSGVGETGSIFEINLVTGVGTPVYTYNAKEFKLDGLAFDEDTQLFYFIDDDVSGVGRGLFSIDIFNNGAPVYLSDFPASQSTTLAGGLAIHKGLAYLVPGRAGPTDAPIAVWDIDAGMFIDPIENPLEGVNKQGGAAWVTVPTPGSLVILAAGGVVALRQRRSRIA